MKYQSYYTRTSAEYLSDTCDLSKDILVNCAGAVNDRENDATAGIRKDYYMIYMVSGYMGINFRGTQEIMNTGDLVIISPGTRYSQIIKKGSGLNYLWLHFTGSNVINILEDAQIPLNHIVNCKQPASIIDYWQRVYHEFILQDRHFTQMTSAILTEILSLFSRQLIYNTSHTRFFESILYIHENYKEKIPIKTLAAMENLSESHYRSVFAQVFKKSPTEYITSVRINAAKELLETSNKQLHEIAYLTGWTDVYYFGKQFKKIVGVSPGSYRRSNQKSR